MAQNLNNSSSQRRLGTSPLHNLLIQIVPIKVRRHADIERAVVLTCQHVDAGLFQSDVGGAGSQPSLGRRAPSPFITVSIFEAILNSLLNWKWNKLLPPRARQRRLPRRTQLITGSRLHEAGLHL